MCEVTKANFEEIFPSIENDIKRADFIALDTEFTGLVLSPKEKPSLFDNGEQRYQKLRTTVSNFTMSQIGISMFTKDEDNNSYKAHTYNMFLYPCVFGPIDVKFTVQASSFNFLCQHRFDFNKMMYEGVSFLNETQEKRLKDHLDRHDYFMGLDRDVDENALQKCCSQVAEWLVKASEGDSIMLDEQDLEGLSHFHVVTEIRERFQEAWATKSLDGQIIVERVSKEKQEALCKETKLHEEERILNEKLGFTRVFRCMTKYKKPLVGHNQLMDLLFIYDKFYKPLPAKFSTFKADIIELFPAIYDTKHISSRIRRQYEDQGFFENTSLGELYQKLQSDNAKYHALFSPSISHAKDFDAYNGNHHPHEAGYDAFMCGVVFLRMAHFIAVDQLGDKKVRPMSFIEHQIALQDYLNRVNIIRATIINVNLGGADPESRRPQWLFVKSRKIMQPLDSTQLARMFSPYGSADIQLRSRTQGVVAVSNWRCSRDILNAFKKNEFIYVARYSVWRHSPIVRNILWTGVILSGTMCAWTLFKGLHSNRS